MFELLKEISPDLAEFVSARKFLQTNSLYSPECFGNIVVELTSIHVDVKITRDRSQVFIDISPPGKTEWYGLEYVLEFIQGKEGKDPIPLTLDDNNKRITAFMMSYETIVHVMNDNLASAALTAFVDKKVRER